MGPLSLTGELMKQGLQKMQALFVSEKEALESIGGFFHWQGTRFPDAFIMLDTM
jgi:hypothetical protein